MPIVLAVAIICATVVALYRMSLKHDLQIQEKKLSANLSMAQLQFFEKNNDRELLP